MDILSREFDGQVVLITGAAQGLGRAVALGFAARGAKLAMVDVQEKALYETVQQVRQLGSPCTPIIADLAVPGQIDRIVRRSSETLGGVHVLVNNAAMSSIQPILEVTEREWDRIFTVNVKAVFFLLQACAKVMKERGGGVIVNVSSPATRMTLTDYTSYATSKAALDYITRTAAANLGSWGIRVNAVAPGRMDTPMQRITEVASAKAAGISIDEYIESRTRDIPLRRRTTPEEVAQGVIWLASKQSSYVTGNRLNISGGLELA